MAISKANKIIPSLLKEAQKLDKSITAYSAFQDGSDAVFSETSLLSFLNISPGKSWFVHILNTTHLSLLKSYITFHDVITIRIIAKQFRTSFFIQKLRKHICFRPVAFITQR